LLFLSVSNCCSIMKSLLWSALLSYKAEDVALVFGGE
jgi:hypothetical protein